MANFNFEYTDATNGKTEIFSMTPLRVRQTKEKLDEIAKLNADSDDRVFLTRCFGYFGSKTWHENADPDFIRDTSVIIQGAHGKEYMNEADFNRFIEEIRNL